MRIWKINMKQCNALQVAEIGGLPILVSISSVLLFFDDAQRFGAWLPWWTNRFATSLESFWRRSDLKTSVGLSVFLTGNPKCEGKRKRPKEPRLNCFWLMDLKFCWSNQDLSLRELRGDSTEKNNNHSIIITITTIIIIINNNNNILSGHAIFVWVPIWDTGALFDAAQ